MDNTDIKTEQISNWSKRHKGSIEFLGLAFRTGLDFLFNHQSNEGVSYNFTDNFKLSRDRTLDQGYK